MFFEIFADARKTVGSKRPSSSEAPASAEELLASLGGCAKTALVALREETHTNKYAKHIRKLREIETPYNYRILDLAICSPNLVYWVGIATGITFATHL